MNLGFIGCGNMGGAILGGLIGQHFEKKENIKVFDISKKLLDNVCDKYGVMRAEDECDAAASDVIFLCVKPNMIQSVCEKIKDVILNDTLIISIAAGVKIETIKNFIASNRKIIRVMPNIPALYGEGMSAVCSSDAVTSEEESYVLEAFSSFGKAEAVSESLMDTVTAVSGSSPAMVFMLIEAMADGAVQGGMTRQKAYTFAAQTVLGSAKMAIESLKENAFPSELKDRVCSPGGTTIDMVASLEKSAFRGSIMEALRVCGEKSKKLS